MAEDAAEVMTADPPEVLVIQGLYRYVRTPRYLSVTAIVLGEVLLTRSRGLLVYWGIWFTAVNLFVLGMRSRPSGVSLARAMTSMLGSSGGGFPADAGEPGPRIGPDDE